MEIWIEKLKNDMNKIDGKLVDSQLNVYSESPVYTWAFQFGDVKLTLLMYKIKEDTWILHHQFSKEKAKVAKRFAHLCAQLQKTFSDDVHETLVLSSDILSLLCDSYLLLVLKSNLQNYWGKKFKIGI